MQEQMIPAEVAMNRIKKWNSSIGDVSFRRLLILESLSYYLQAENRCFERIS